MKSVRAFAFIVFCVQLARARHRVVRFLPYLPSLDSPSLHSNLELLYLPQPTIAKRLEEVFHWLLSSHARQTADGKSCFLGLRAFSHHQHTNQLHLRSHSKFLVQDGCALDTCSQSA